MIQIKNNNQIKSKTRVQQAGECFTNNKEVNAMIDLAKDEISKIDSKILEPACGNGNFIIEILNRKLQTITTLNQFNNLSLNQCNNLILQAISSIYGIDIMLDNVQECKTRIKEKILNYYKFQFNTEIEIKILELLNIILNKNIICGDTLEMVFKDPQDDLYNTEIVLVDWIFNKEYIVCKEYKYSSLIDNSNIIIKEYQIRI